MVKSDYKGLIELAFRRYAKEKDNIENGWMKTEHHKMVADALMLDEVKNEELSDLWYAVRDYFLAFYAVFDKNGEVVGWKPYSEEIEFIRDTESAWLEVVNSEARKRRAEGRM